jgi:hypothetical protein
MTFSRTSTTPADRDWLARLKTYVVSGGAPYSVETKQAAAVMAPGHLFSQPQQSWNVQQYQQLWQQQDHQPNKSCIRKN